MEHSIHAMTIGAEFAFNELSILYIGRRTRRKSSVCYEKGLDYLAQIMVSKCSQGTLLV